MVKISRFGKTIRRYQVRLSLLIHVLFLCACSGQVQTISPTSQPTPTYVIVPTSSETPLPIPPSTSELPMEQDSSDPVQSESFVSGTIQLERIVPTKINSLQSFSKAQGLLLPDLVTLSPTDLNIRVNPVTGLRLLRFTNSIMNAGPGKMELWGKNNPSSGKTTVAQHIYYNTEDSIEKKIVGEFFFHPEHNHWHLGDFAHYEIWSLGRGGSLDSVVAASNKVSYCLRDDESADIPNASVWQSYTNCNSERQGISVGWIDIYKYHLPGQSIDISLLEDGIYALWSTVDPDNRLLDKNPANNTAILYIAIEGNRVNVVEAPGNTNRLLDGEEE